MQRMLAAARVQVIIAEPIRNLSDSRLGLLAAFARRHTERRARRPRLCGSPSTPSKHSSIASR